jgi:hypothetical protein
MLSDPLADPLPVSVKFQLRQTVTYVIPASSSYKYRSTAAYGYFSRAFHNLVVLIEILDVAHLLSTAP